MGNVSVFIYDKYLSKLKSRKSWTLITGFPGFGYVGTIATKYIVEKLKAKKIGDIITKYMPDFIAPEEYGIMTPYEIFMHEGKSLIIVVNNALPQPPERVLYAKKLVEWFISIGGRSAILAGGLNSKFKEGNEEYRWLCTDRCSWNLSEPKLSKGLYIVGPLAVLFMMLKLKGVPTIVILPYTEPSKYDPRAAAIFVSKVNELLNLNISIDDLLRYSKIIEETETAIKEAMRESEERGPKPYM